MRCGFALQTMSVASLVVGLVVSNPAFAGACKLDSDPDYRGVCKTGPVSCICHKNTPEWSCNAHSTCRGGGGEKCPGGYYYPSATCVECPTGNYRAAGTDDTACTHVTSGNEVNGGRTGQNPCPANTVNDGSHDKCQTCPSGQHPNGDSTKCESCPAGTTWSPRERTCKSCSGGQSWNEAKQACVCPAGQQWNTSTSTCVDCSGVNVWDTAGNRCVNPTACSAGTGFDYDRVRCVRCATGHVRAAASTNPFCQRCPAGEVPATDGASCRARCTGAKAYWDGASCKTCNADEILVVNTTNPGSSGEKKKSRNFVVRPGTQCGKCNAALVPNSAGLACVAAPATKKK